ncbi:hypothetical protein Dimus_025146 [Dionaea muscipula]
MPVLIYHLPFFCYQLPSPPCIHLSNVERQKSNSLRYDLHKLNSELSVELKMSKFDPYDHLKLTLNADGTITRNHNVQTKKPDPNPLQGQSAVSKDVIVNPQTKTWVRIFRPSSSFSSSSSSVAADRISSARLPIIVFFHGGGWIMHSASDAIYHDKCLQYAADIPAIIVSVDYRHAPENRLPAQYEDAVDAISWVKRQAVDPHGEKWLRESADFSRCFLVGRQNGANIAFNAAIRVSAMQLSPLRICGVVLNQPMFSGKQRTKSELRYATDDLLPLPVLDLMWELALPKGTDRDHRYCNPMKDEVQRKKVGDIGRCLVIGYGQDPMIDKQREFVSMLVGNGARVEAHFDDIGFHGIDLVDHKRAAINIQFFKDFILHK